MAEKEIFSIIFILLAFLLLLMPFLVTFNDILTKLVEKFELYMWAQEKVVPIQTQLVGAFVRPFGISYEAYRDGMVVNGVPMRMTWNCIGWQSLLLLLITFTFGFSFTRGLTLESKIECIVIGIFGTFFVNILRLSFISLLAVYTPAIFAVIFHDYFAALTTIIWLFFFWWFSYKYVLAPKTTAE